ncbi:dd3f0703-fd97-4482-b398-60b10acda154 [Sclerotinia trifoliorum]|uniref:non-specific serine/threonine protein kinase n=1 Tax=Sclerotinia trifoliorum TaxID=28548 RepID=A0A8H2ZQ98_9HELO|nr:dd3f0703-fd97-4482-b398-60b10acda154 [Sclerotinia trifoliorum]
MMTSSGQKSLNLWVHELLPSSEASKLSERIMKERNLLTKRFNETKCYLRYIRSGHPSICSMEAFFDHRGGGEIFSTTEDIAHGHIFEYCDWGTLQNLIKKYYRTPLYSTGRLADRDNFSRPEGMPPLYTHAAIPEAFIWHVFLQLMDGLSFLHGDHELNKQDEFHRRNQVICIDIKLDNILLKDSGVPNTYPTVKIADFGEAIYVPHGESRWHDMGTTFCPPSDEPWYSAKYDVWCVGISLYIMSHSGRQPYRVDDPLHERDDLSVEPRWTRPDAHLSQTLCRELERPLEMDMEKRWTAIRIFNRIKPKAEAMIRSTYRELQDWVKPDFSGDNFDDGYLEWVQGGGVPSDIEEDGKDDDKKDNDDGGGGGDSDGEKHADIPDPAAAPISKKISSKKQQEMSKRRREEEEREKENLPPVRPSKRRLISSLK